MCTEKRGAEHGIAHMAGKVVEISKKMGQIDLGGLAVVESALLLATSEPVSLRKAFMGCSWHSVAELQLPQKCMHADP